jgi:hypothetical protein
MPLGHVAEPREAGELRHGGAEEADVTGEVVVEAEQAPHER